MSSIDAAIIKALVEHVGGDSSCIPDGSIGGVSYTAGDGINIANNNISVEFDSNTMELKDGKISAKTQLTTGDGLTTSNGKIIANLDTNTMLINSGKISAKTQLAAGDGISISSGKVNVNYDSNTMELKDGKLAAKVSNNLTWNDYVKQTDSKFNPMSYNDGAYLFSGLTMQDIQRARLYLRNSSTGSKYFICVGQTGDGIRFWSPISKIIIYLQVDNSKGIIFPRTLLNAGWQVPSNPDTNDYGFFIHPDNQECDEHLRQRDYFSILNLCGITFEETK